MSELSYEAQRLQNIRDNEALLLSLGLSTTDAKPKSRPTAPRTKSTNALRQTVANGARKRRLDSHDEINRVDDGKADKAARMSARSARYLSNGGDEPSPSLRRSGRVSGRLTPNYSERHTSDHGSPGLKDGSRYDNRSDNDDRQRNAAKLGVRTQDPKQFGHIPGVEVGRWWASRMECSTDAIHAPTVAGISGNALEGAWSVALSGGYPDDVDLGEAFTYTGSGGRDLKGTKNAPKNLRTAPQSFDQSFETPLNAALKLSAKTRKPVRVIRGFKLDSPYAPATGYRYDGIYVVERAWMATGLTKGLLVCRYAFKRVKGQPPLPERSTQEDEDE